jgi:alkylhydroperoxidase family enzyme
MGVTEDQILGIGRYEESDAFDEDERLVIEFAAAATETPSAVTDELRDRLLARFTKGQVAELASMVAWENHRARLNRALGVREVGFSDGAVCALPEGHAALQPAPEPPDDPSL